MTTEHGTPTASGANAPVITSEAPELNTRRFLVLVALAGVGFGMTAPLTVLYAAGLGASDALAGLAVSSIAISLLLVDAFGTRLVPRVDGRFSMWFSLLVFGVGSLASAVASDVWQMIAARVFQGFGAAFFMGGALQVVVRFAPVGGAGRAIGAFNASWFGGIAIGPALGGWLSGHGPGVAGYRLAFAICGAVCFVVALVARTLLPSIPSGQTPRVSLPTWPTSRPGLRLWPGMSLAMAGQITRAGLVMTLLPLYGERAFGLSTTRIGLAQSVLAVVDLAAMRYGGSLADRYGRRSVLLVAFVSGAAACLWGLVVSGQAFALWAGSLGIVVGITWVVPVAVIVDVASVPEDGLATYRIAADAGQLGGSTAMGALIGAGGAVGGLTIFALAFAGLAGWVLRLPELSSAGASARPRLPEEISDART